MTKIRSSVLLLLCGFMLLPAMAQTMTAPNVYPPSTARPKTKAAAPQTMQNNGTLKKAGLKPLSRVAVGVGVSPLGIGFLAATNLNRYLNLRATGNFLNFSVNNISTNGFNVNASLNMASAGASLDYYPFHNWLRLSPGILFYNQNQANAVFTAAAGTSFTLNNITYYSASGSNAVQGIGTFGLGNGSVAPTITAGIGNLFPSSGRHWSFPFEVGVAFIQTPTIALNLTGEVCDVNGLNCVNVATDPTVQSNLAAQVSTYQSDIQPLHTYPIVSFGVAYNFRIRK